MQLQVNISSCFEAVNMLWQEDLCENGAKNSPFFITGILTAFYHFKITFYIFSNGSNYLEELKKY